MVVKQTVITAFSNTDKVTKIHFDCSELLLHTSSYLYCFTRWRYKNVYVSKYRNFKGDVDNQGKEPFQWSIFSFIDAFHLKRLFWRRQTSTVVDCARHHLAGQICHGWLYQCLICLTGYSNSKAMFVSQGPVSLYLPPLISYLVLISSWNDIAGYNGYILLVFVFYLSVGIAEDDIIGTVWGQMSFHSYSKR